MDTINHKAHALSGVFDPHIHTSPDVIDRCMDDLELARAAVAIGMRGILIKSHVESTASRAYLVQKILQEEAGEDFYVLGGLALNHQVGGLNPLAVEAALSLGAKEIWMPTLSSAHSLKAKGREEEKGVRILQDGKLKEEVYEILALIALKDAILGTGHLSVEEILILVQEAKNQKVEKILITHPDSPTSSIPLDTQIELRNLGVFFERCYLPAAYESQEAAMIFQRICFCIRTVGVESTVLATDLGRRGTIDPVSGMVQFLKRLSREGFNDTELLRMGGETFRRLAGLS